MYEHYRIRPRSTIMATGDSKFIMMRESGAAEGVAVTTSNPNKKLANSKQEVMMTIYKDVIIETDVWLGINVTLLPEARIGREYLRGRCCYQEVDTTFCCFVESPARIIKFKYSIEDIIQRDMNLHVHDEQLSRDTLENNYKEFIENKK